MASNLSKEDFLKLWGKFGDDPHNMAGGINDYKSLLDSAQTLYNKRELEADFVKGVFEAVRKICPHC